ncbi:hypothetical protein [Methanothermococcus thermolithotrophicus]|uniref:hypothetical protein n=1 Tax=Methanothermococcus thermolithotrophicus TaxID=2186 RepID=UPI0003638867|nr:hypothetical protein [Methanothermococcus thermolithotrophicus]
MALDTATIMSFIQSHWLELLIVLGIAWAIRNWHVILIGVIVVIVLANQGYDLSSLKDIILSHLNLSSVGFPLSFLNQTVNSTLNNTNILG